MKKMCVPLQNPTKRLDRSWCECQQEMTVLGSRSSLVQIIFVEFRWVAPYIFIHTYIHIQMTAYHTYMNSVCFIGCVASVYMFTLFLGHAPFIIVPIQKTLSSTPQE